MEADSNDLRFALMQELATFGRKGKDRIMSNDATVDNPLPHRAMDANVLEELRQMGEASGEDL